MNWNLRQVRNAVYVLLAVIFGIRLLMYQKWSFHKTTCDILDTHTQKLVFGALGPVTDTSCRKLESFGSGDDEKRVCMDDIDPSEPCLVFSIGSNNQWGFEEAIAARTHCKVKTFDCTGDFSVPRAIQSRVEFHKLCVGSSTEGEFITWLDLVKTFGKPTVVKMDIEGWEWSVLRQITKHSAPRQVLAEIHACSYFQAAALPQPPYVESSGDVSDYWNRDTIRYVKLANPIADIGSLMEQLKTKGLFLLDRHDNPYCLHCSEIVLRAKLQ